MSAAASRGEARRILSEVFGHPDFRPGQLEAVEAALGGRDVVVLLPTGSGKSLCYQIPALWASGQGRGTTIVVSPLIALMQDQVGALRARGIAAAALHSHQDEQEQDVVVAAFLRGELVFLYVSPERTTMPGFRRLLARTPVALVAIDEAHCVSQWGHDFRPDYLRLAELREVVAAPIVALTATATPVVLEEIESKLALEDARRVRTGFERPNLGFAVRGLRTEAERTAATLAALDRAGVRGARGRGRAIVYCSTRKVTERVAKALRAAGVRVGHYHAGRTKTARERAQRAFEQGRTRVLVATNAFGMGIDLPDIRLVVHYQTPGSVEAYYQEAGRAGRDGERACCLLFFGRADLATQRRLARVASTSVAQDRRREDALVEIERYATGSRCRHDALVSHFTGEEGCERPCGRCDVCLGESTDVETEPSVDVTRDRRGDRVDSPTGAVPAHEALACGDLVSAGASLSEHDRERIVSAVDRLSRPVGRRSLAQALRGGGAKKLARGGLLTLPEYGLLAAYSEDVLVAAIDALIAEGRLRRAGQKYPTVWIPGKPIRSKRMPRARGETLAGESACEHPNPARAAREAGASTKRRRERYGGDIARALDSYRKRRARALGWKTYMIFQRNVLLAIDRVEPATLEELARIPGLGPAKLERFGDDILEIVRSHRSRTSR